MDTDRFAHIVNENKAMRDEYISELIKHTMDLQKQVIKTNRPSFLHRFGNGFLEACQTTGEGDPVTLMIHLLFPPLVFLILSWSSYGIFSLVVDDFHQVISGEVDPPGNTIAAYSIDEDGDECHTIVARRHNGGYTESACIKDPFDALMIIRDLEYGRIQVQSGSNESPQEVYTSSPASRPENRVRGEEVKQQDNSTDTVRGGLRVAEPQTYETSGPPFLSQWPQ